MAKIICPVCETAVSSSERFCPNCGIRLDLNDTVTYEVKEENDDAALSSLQPEQAPVHTGYDLLLFAFTGGITAKSALLAELLATSRYRSNQILHALPTYLYTDIGEEEALSLGEMLEVHGFCSLVIDPYGKKTVFLPEGYRGNASGIYIPRHRLAWLDTIPSQSRRRRLMKQEKNVFSFLFPLLKISTPRRQSAPRNSSPSYRSRKPGTSRGPMKGKRR